MFRVASLPFLPFGSYLAGNKPIWTLVGIGVTIVVAMANVKIYTTPACVYCRVAKDFFAKRNIAYEEYDVVKDSTAREEMIEKSSQMGVPVIEIDGQIFIGFNRLELEKVLKVV